MAESVRHKLRPQRRAANANNQEMPESALLAEDLSAMDPCGKRFDPLQRLLDFAPHLGLRDVEDPYYGGARHFELVLEQIEAGADGLLAEIARKLAR